MEHCVRAAAKYTEEINMHKAKYVYYLDLKMSVLLLCNPIISLLYSDRGGNLLKIWGRSSWTHIVNGNAVTVHIDLVQAVQYVKLKAKTYKHKVQTYQQPCSKRIMFWKSQFSCVLLLASVKSRGKHSSCLGPWARYITSFILAVGCW